VHLSMTRSVTNLLVLTNSCMHHNGPAQAFACVIGLFVLNCIRWVLEYLGELSITMTRRSIQCHTDAQHSSSHVGRGI